MAKRNWEDDEDIVRQVRDRDLSAGGASAALMSDDDYGATLYNSKLWQTADAAGRAALHDRNEQIKAKYGFSGGAAGNEYIPLDKSAGYQAVISDALRRMDGYGSYESPYRAGLDAKYAAVRDRQPFSYDPESDPRWAAYKKQYTRAGRMAYDDALAKLSARTGGLASSYAGGVAQQRYGDYMQQMTDKIPELYKLAYDMYAADAARDIADLNALRGLDSDAYGRWSDGYGRLGEAYSRASGERAYADTRADKARADAIALAKLGAQYKDDSGLRALGIDPVLATGGGGKAARGQTAAADEADAADAAETQDARDAAMAALSALLAGGAGDGDADAAKYRSDAWRYRLGAPQLPAFFADRLRQRWGR